MNPENKGNEILSFEDWAKSFEAANPEERVSLSKDAARLMKDRGLMRVIAEMERNALQAIKSCSLQDRDLLYELKCVLHGVESLRRALIKIVDTERYEKKRDAARDEKKDMARTRGDAAWDELRRE